MGLACQVRASCSVSSTMACITAKQHPSNKGCVHGVSDSQKDERLTTCDLSQKDEKLTTCDLSQKEEKHRHGNG
eukprot:1158867-Pelagomonas_calceolata.AAC.21